MKDKTSNKKRDLLLIIGFFSIGIVTFVISAIFDSFELFSSWVQKFEEYNIDEIVSVILVWFIYLFVIVVFKNKSEHKQKKELAELSTILQNSLDEKDRLYSIIAHDLRSPFNSLIGFSDILLRRHNTIDSVKQKEMILLINNTARSTLSLLYNLLDWARLNANMIQIRRKEINISKLADEAINSLQMGAYNKNISLNNKIPNNTIVYADENMVATVIRNILSNAIKFSHNNSSVSIISRKLEGFVEVTISDSGVGLSPEQIKVLFNKVFNSTKGTNNEEGTGLGMKVCKAFIERNMGEIRVESIAGKGADFIFTVPDKEM